MTEPDQTDVPSRSLRHRWSLESFWEELPERVRRENDLYIDARSRSLHRLNSAAPLLVRSNPSVHLLAESLTGCLKQRSNNGQQSIAAVATLTHIKHISLSASSVPCSKHFNAADAEYASCTHIDGFEFPFQRESGNIAGQQVPDDCNQNAFALCGMHRYFLREPAGFW